MMKKLLCVLLCWALLPCFAAPVWAAPVTVPAESAVLMEKETGTVLYAQNEHVPLAPASVTKVMTLLLVMEAIDDGRLSYDDVLTASAYAASMGGSQVYLEAGEQMTVEDLLKAVCVASGNDAAVCLAEGVAGSEEAFVARMNERAAELGMEDTHFCNCTGLPAEGHLTSAYDIALMSRALILDHPDIRRFTTIWMDSLRGGEFQLANTNKLIHRYEGATGLKTGSTDEALYCLSATAERDGMELIAAVMKAPSSDERFAAAETLLTYGFANYTLLAAGPDEVLPTIPVAMGEKDCVQPVYAEGAHILVSKTQAAGAEKDISLESAVSAPVRRGQQLGTLTVTSGGEVLATLPLVAGETVERLTYWEIAQKILRSSLFVS